MSGLEAQLTWDQSSLDKAFAELEADITAVVKGVAATYFELVVLATPQFAGGMAASWSYSLNSPSYVDRSSSIPTSNLEQGYSRTQTFRSVSPKSKGHMVAVNIAMAANYGADSAFKLGDTIYISNGVDHGEGQYSQWVEDNPQALRSVNQPGAPVRMSVAKFDIRFSGGVDHKGAAILRNIKVGMSTSLKDYKFADNKTLTNDLGDL